MHFSMILLAVELIIFGFWFRVERILIAYEFFFGYSCMVIWKLRRSFIGDIWPIPFIVIYVEGRLRISFILCVIVLRLGGYGLISCPLIIIIVSSFVLFMNGFIWIFWEVIMPQVRGIGECALEWRCGVYGFGLFGGMLSFLIMVHEIVAL